MLRINLTEAAARTSYLAGFHAAQAFIWEQTGKSVRTHQGVHSEFYRLTKDDPDFDPELRIFLSITYNLKAIADYQTGPDAEVSHDRAIMALEQAKRFVTYFEAALTSQ